MTILPVHVLVTLTTRRFCRTLVGTGLRASPTVLIADVTLSHLFGDNLVLQRQKPVPVWGTAVRFGWDDQAMPNLCNEAGLPASPFRTDFVPWHALGR